jgi:hypothetical protein
MAINPDNELAALRERTLEHKRSMLESEAQELTEQIVEGQSLAKEYLQRGDLESARIEDENVMALESDLQSRLLDLHTAGGGPPVTSAAKQQWMARRQDIVGPQNANALGAVHQHITQTMQVPDDSREYFELMSHAAEPPGYQPLITPDEVGQTLGVDAKTYNRNVRELQRRKSLGDYKDK